MSLTPTFSEAYKRPRQVRKREGTPRLLPPEVSRPQRQVVADVGGSLTAENAGAALEAAIREAARQVVARALRTLEEVRARQSSPTRAGLEERSET